MKRLFSALLALGLSLSLTVPAAALEVEDAKQLLKTYYVDSLPEGFDEMDSLDEILSAINDPYTIYLTADEYQQLLSSINGSSVVGIGVSINTVFDNGYQILSILPGSPALEVDLKAGDRITAVDGVELTASMDPAALIRGEAGTQVTLTILRENGQVCQVSITRQEVSIPIVTYEMSGDALAIQCDSFGDSTAKTIAQALTELEEDAAICIVDLRANPGGTSTAAAGSAGLFVGSGIMSYFRDADGKYNYVYTLPSCPDMTDKPLIVLTSSYSASGSELFAAAIRDYGAGIGLGQRTFGKGVAQYIFDESIEPDLFDGDCLKITVYRFFSPEGATNDTVGVLPTLMISSENTVAAALLLSSPKPQQAQGYLKLEIAGQIFYLDLEHALEEENRSAFIELLESLPGTAKLYQGVGGGWTSTTPSVLAENLGLHFTPRTFSDTADSQFEQAINTLACYQLLSGYEDGTFRPGQTITRAEFCAMVCAALDLPLSENTAFSDVPSSAWYAGAVGAMSGRGFLSGYGDGTFRPNATITYEEMVAVLANVSAWACMDGYDYAQMELAGQAPQVYGAFSPWARTAARNLDLLGALVGELQPSDSGTREVAAGMLCALMEGAGLLWN